MAYSGDDPAFRMTPKQRYDAAIARKMTELKVRMQVCDTYAIRARNKGWKVDTTFVSDHLPWFDAWAHSLISSGQLINRLGIKRMTRSEYMEWSVAMTIPKAVMLDTVRTTAHNIPKATPFVGGYVTGSGVVPWSATEWALFPESRHVRIYQDPGQTIDPHSWDVMDMESGAFNAAQVALVHKTAVDAGKQWTCVYATRINFMLAAQAIKSLRGDYWDGHVCVWLADWNLNLEQASALIGSAISGATCIGVQWASPSSNPHTMVPGGSYVLSQANLDISVVNANWVPSISFSAPPVTTPKPATIHGELITDDSHGNLQAREVSSSDDIHWQ